MTISSFSDLEISPAIIQAIEGMGFEEPTPIQKQAIPIILTGRDVTGQAHTGTGKTAAYAIPAIQRCSAENRSVQVLVLCPTRELCVQIATECSKLLAYTDGIRVLPVYGGQPIETQLRALKRGVQICIGTPGRIIDHISRGTLDLSSVVMVVLDEADQMLDMGFRPDIEAIMEQVPKERQMVIFSATMPKPILQISRRFQHDPEMVRIVPKDLTVPQIHQYYIEIPEHAKGEVLCRLLDRFMPSRSIVFSNTKKGVDLITDHLRSRGYLAEGLHGDLKQVQRDRVMNAFRAGSLDLLVATDVAARGIDVQDVDIVFNYEVPQDTEYYVHRIGRTARAGKGGQSISFVSSREKYRLKEIERYAHTRLTMMQVPSADEISESRARDALDQIREVAPDEDMSLYENMISDLVSEGIDPVRIAASLLKQQSAYEEAEVFQFGNQSSQSRHESRGEHSRLFISAGRKDGISPRDIVNVFSSECNIPKKAVGDIDMYPEYSFVQIPSEYVEQVISIMDGGEIRGVRLGVRPARPRRT